MRFAWSDAQKHKTCAPAILLIPFALSLSTVVWRLTMALAVFAFNANPVPPAKPIKERRRDMIRKGQELLKSRRLMEGSTR
jgi:hypothetical protein